MKNKRKKNNNNTFNSLSHSLDAGLHGMNMDVNYMILFPGCRITWNESGITK